MTEAEWLACDSPYTMLNILQDRASDRKLMLFSVACLRRIWHLLTDERSRQVVELTEELVDNLASEELLSAYGDAFEAFATAYAAAEIQDGAGGHTHEAVECVSGRGYGNALQVASKGIEAAGYVAAQATPVVDPDGWSSAKTEAWRSGKEAELVAQATLLHDIIGNPFRPVIPDPTWLTATVLKLAQAIYDDRAFDHLPILGDALEEAGCDNQDILNHCRQPGEHVRGCWALDLVLGKRLNVVTTIFE